MAERNKQYWEDEDPAERRRKFLLYHHSGPKVSGDYDRWRKNNPNGEFDTFVEKWVRENRDPENQEFKRKRITEFHNRFRNNYPQYKAWTQNNQEALSQIGIGGGANTRQSRALIESLVNSGIAAANATNAAVTPFLDRLQAGEAQSSFEEALAEIEENRVSRFEERLAEVPGTIPSDLPVPRNPDAMGIVSRYLRKLYQRTFQDWEQEERKLRGEDRRIPTAPDPQSTPTNRPESDVRNRKSSTSIIKEARREAQDTDRSFQEILEARGIEGVSDNG
jgi:hypothetical protein